MRRLFWTAVSAVVSLTVLVTPLLAARADRPPTVESKPPWLAIVFSFVFTVAVCVVAFKNSRRTHLD